MVYLWLFIAFGFMAFLVWRDTVQAGRRRKEIEELRDLREDLVNIREDVQMLLEQLDEAAESAVDKVSSAVAAGRQEDDGLSAKPDREEQPLEKPLNSSPANDISPKHQMVYSLADEGYSANEIAHQLNIGKGEVSLILQLKAKDSSQ